MSDGTYPAACYTDIEWSKPEPYRYEFRGVCACGWQGPPRPRSGPAVHDCTEHLRETVAPRRLDGGQR